MKEIDFDRPAFCIEENEKMNDISQNLPTVLLTSQERTKFYIVPILDTDQRCVEFIVYCVYNRCEIRIW